MYNEQDRYRYLAILFQILFERLNIRESLQNGTMVKIIILIKATRSFNGNGIRVSVMYNERHLYRHLSILFQILFDRLNIKKNLQNGTAVKIIIFNITH